MKKKLLTLGFLSILTAFGQTFTDNFDTYTAGQKLCPQSGGAWTTWSNDPGGTEDVLVSNASAFSGSNSLYFATSAQTGGPVDLVRNLGVLNTGQFDMDFNILVESGKAGYFNFQRNATIGQIWSMDCFFNDTGTLLLNNQNGLNFTGATYPQNTWFNFRISINFNTNNWEVFIDNISVGSFSNPVNQIASIDIFPMDKNAPYSCGYFIDDFHYEVTSYTLPTLNTAINGLSSDQGFLVGNEVTPKVLVRNLGSAPITSFDIDVEYNGNTITKSVTGLNLASLATTTVTMDGPLTLAAGNIAMTATVSNVNSGTDLDANDDELSININPLAPAVGKMVVSEEGTGTWCSWCPRGAVFMDLMETKYSNYWAGIAVHNDDPMVVPIYDEGMAEVVAGYPSALVDRMPAINPVDMEEEFLTRIQIAPKALIQNGATWNAATRELKVSVSAAFLSSATSSYKLGIVLTEDEVTGTGSNYNQANGYAGGSEGVMGGFETLPNPVPAAQMVYDHVARAIRPSFTGYANSFPATVNTGETHTITANFTLPASWDETKIHIVGLLFNPAGIIDNAGKSTIMEAVANGFVPGTDVTTVGLNDLSQVDDWVKIYPNPATTVVSVSLQLKAQSDITISVTDISGKEISSKNYGQMNGTSVITINTSNTPAGVYFVNVKMDHAITRKKVIIQ